MGEFDHPYVYNMPPGPDSLTALLLKVSGSSYHLTRLAFALIFLAPVNEGDSQNAYPHDEAIVEDVP